MLSTFDLAQPFYYKRIMHISVPGVVETIQMYSKGYKEWLHFDFPVSFDSVYLLLRGRVRLIWMDVDNVGDIPEDGAWTPSSGSVRTAEFTKLSDWIDDFGHGLRELNEPGAYCTIPAGKWYCL